MYLNWTGGAPAGNDINKDCYVHCHGLAGARWILQHLFHASCLQNDQLVAGKWQLEWVV